LSLLFTPREFREGNNFGWGPIVEVAKLFAGIFITIIPVIAMLRAGANGAFAPLLTLLNNPDGTPNNAMYFWLTGGLSSFLDNAPTYVVFFEIAKALPHMPEEAYVAIRGGEIRADLLTAISLGSVFMGANTYIGNGPNFMVKAIAEGEGITMPSFFGYMAWSVGILIPLLVLAEVVFP
jgi:Na+/H+ antiporter NhaD/arsenite permease-like protein